MQNVELRLLVGGFAILEQKRVKAPEVGAEKQFKPFCILTFEYMGGSMEFVVDKEHGDKMQEGKTYKIDARISRQGYEIKLSSPKFEEVRPSTAKV